MRFQYCQYLCLNLIWPVDLIQWCQLIYRVLLLYKWINQLHQMGSFDRPTIHLCTTVKHWVTRFIDSVIIHFITINLFDLWWRFIELWNHLRFCFISICRIICCWLVLAESISSTVIQINILWKYVYVLKSAVQFSINSFDWSSLVWFNDRRWPALVARTVLSGSKSCVQC